MTFSLGSLSSVSASEHPEWLAAPTLATLEALGLLGEVGVVGIDPAISDTAATQDAFGLESDSLANCVIVGGRRGDVERVAGCVVLASTRLDVNGAVRRRLDARKASFLPMDDAVTRTGMEHGGITPVGLPGDWPILIDSRVTAQPVVIIGSGVRASKILLPGALLERLPGAEVIEDLALLRE